MYATADKLDAHLDAVHATGIDPPDDWSALAARHAAYLDIGTPIVQRLADAVVDGADEDLAMLHALALSEIAATPMDHAAVDNIVRAAVLAKLREIYAPHAQENYDRVAAEFDAFAKKFTAAAGLVDPETDPAQMVNAGPKQRAAWTDAERYALMLTIAMARLKAAAALAGTRDAERGEVLIPLVADVSGCHRRRVWEAWRTTSGRTKRWGCAAANRRHVACR